MKFIEHTSDIELIYLSNIQTPRRKYCYLYSPNIDPSIFTFKAIRTAYMFSISVGCNEYTGDIFGSYRLSDNRFQHETFIPFSMEIFHSRFNNIPAHGDFYNEQKMSEHDPLIITVRNNTLMIKSSTIGNTLINSVDIILGDLCGLNVWKLMNEKRFIKFVDN